MCLDKRERERNMNTRMMILAIACLAALAIPVEADPVQVYTEPSSLQDDWVVEDWVEELSTCPHCDEQLISACEVQWEGHIPCPEDYEGIGTNVQVRITNLTNRDFPDVYYVGDVHDDGSFETMFTNVDELVGDITPPGNTPAPGLAFKIDAQGKNTPLVYESIAPDEVFQAGETWEFVIQEYWNMFALSPACLGSVGTAPYGAIAQASMCDTVSSGSIITPEPMTLSLLAAGGLALLRRKRK